MQIISADLIVSISGGAPEENTPARPIVTITGGGSEDGAYATAKGTIPITPNIDVEPYAKVDTYNGVTEIGAELKIRFL